MDRARERARAIPISSFFKGGDTRHNEYCSVYHSVYALAVQEGETSERAKSRARLVAKYIV